MRSPAPDEATYTGRVKWYNQTKGYGFIELDDRSPDVPGDLFVHARALGQVADRVLMQDDRVRFKMRTGEGPHAGRIQADEVVLL